MKQKKAVVPIVPLHEEVGFMEPVAVVENQLAKALALAEKHEGDAVSMFNLLVAMNDVLNTSDEVLKLAHEMKTQMQ